MALLPDRNKHPRGNIYGCRVSVYRVVVVATHAFSDVSISSNWLCGRKQYVDLRLALVLRFYELGNQTHRLTVRWYPSVPSSVTALFGINSRAIRSRWYVGSDPTYLGCVGLFFLSLTRESVCCRKAMNS